MDERMKFDQIIERRTTNSSKWDMMDQRYGNTDMIHLGVADMDFKAPPAILNALQENVDHGIFGYTEIGSGFYDSIRHWIKQRTNLQIPTEWVVYSIRVKTSISLCVELFTEVGDEIILHSPFYNPLYQAIIRNDRSFIDSPLKLVKGRYEIDFAQMESSITEKTKMLILCNPHNPTGRVWNKEEMEKLEEFCHRHNLLLFSDEIHSDVLAKDSVFHSALENHETDNLIVATSMTKTFNIPGIMVSYMIIPNQEIRDKVKLGIQRMELESANIFAVSTLEAAYLRGEQWYQEMLAYIDDNETYTRKFFETKMPKFRILPREGTFLLWVDYKSIGYSEEQMEEWFQAVDTSVNMGSIFGESGRGYFRINIGAPRGILQKAYERMEKGYLEL